MTTPTERDERMGDRAGEHAEEAREAPPAEKSPERDREKQSPDDKATSSADPPARKPMAPSARPHAMNDEEARGNAVGVGVLSRPDGEKSATPNPAPGVQTGAPD